MIVSRHYPLVWHLPSRLGCSSLSHRGWPVFISIALDYKWIPPWLASLQMFQGSNTGPCACVAHEFSLQLYMAFKVRSFCLRKSVSKDLQVECSCKENVDKEDRSATRWKTLQDKRAVWVMDHTPPSQIFSFERVSSFPKSSTSSVFSIRKQTVLQFPLPSFDAFWRSTWSLYFKSRLERWLSS